MIGMTVAVKGITKGLKVAGRAAKKGLGAASKAAPLVSAGAGTASMGVGIHNQNRMYSSMEERSSEPVPVYGGADDIYAQKRRRGGF